MKNLLLKLYVGVLKDYQTADKKPERSANGSRPRSLPCTKRDNHFSPTPTFGD